MPENIDGQLDQRSLLLGFAICGCIGFAFGLSNSTWQVTVETGQVLSGIVEYPKDNPFYMYHIKVFTIVNHFSSLLLRVGISERVASIIISGLLGLISFEAIGTLIFTISRNVFLSIIGVMLIYLADFTGDGVVYPIWLMGQSHTYGILGTSFAVLSVGLLGCRAYRASLFCIALAPCVHPSIGLWIALVVAVCALLDWRFSSQVLMKYYPYFLAGLLITALSAAYQIHLMVNLPKIDLHIKEQYLNAFIKYWDSHRIAFYWQANSQNRHFPWGIIYCLYSIFASLIGQKLFKENRSIVMVFRIVTLSGILSLLLGFLTQLPQERVPSILLIFMPGRYVNINNLMLVALLYGILTADSNKPYTANYKVFALLVISSFFSRHDEVKVVVLAILLIWVAYLTYGKPALDRYKVQRSQKGYAYLTLICMVLYLTINLPREKYFTNFIWSPEPLEDRTNNKFYSTISKRDGLLLITHYSSLIQLKTRRAILADMASPNFFTYAPESAIVFNRILEQVYGVDLLTPPPAHLRHLEIRPELYKALWESRDLLKWQNIRQIFSVTDVLAPIDWNLKLPIIAKDKTAILYEIPPSTKKYFISDM